MESSIEDIERMLSERTADLQVLRQIIGAVHSCSNLESVLDQIVELVSQVTTADACFLYLFDGSVGTVVLQASKPRHPESIGQIKLDMGEGLTGWVAKERRPVVISRQAFADPRFKAFQQLPEDRYEAFLSVPIRTQDQLVGVINVQHREPRVYSAETVALAEAIGGLVGGAIMNARFYEAVRQHQLQLETLAQVSEAIVSSSYLDETLQFIVRSAAELTGSKMCSLMLLDQTEKTLVLKATHPVDPAYRNRPPINVGTSISGQVVKERHPISVFDVMRDRTFPDVATPEGLQSLLSVPMMIQDRIIGVLDCYRAETHHFRDDEIRILSAIANQAAVAIENTRLLEHGVTLQKSLEDRKIIEKAKGILMKEFHLSEAEAFRRLQKQSMEKGMPMRQIADAVILTDQL